MVDLPAGLSPGENVRLANQVAQVQRARLGNNPAAAGSITSQRSMPHKTPKSPVGTYSDNPAPSPIPPQIVLPQQPINQPAQAAPVQPPVDPIAEYNKQQAIEHLVGSPEMMDAVTKLKLRNHFQGRPDANLGQEALQIVRTTYQR